MDWIATALTLLGMVFNARKSLWCWPLWLAGNVLWLGYAAKTGQGSLAACNVVFLALNVYGWRKWRK